MKNKLILLSLLATATMTARESIDLSGTWQFSQGDTPVYDDVITLPGSMLTNGKGNDVDANTRWTGSLYDRSYYYRDDMAPYREKGNIKFPFFLTPDKEYVGNAFYRRTVEVPRDWKGKRVILSFERPHIETTVYVNGREAGTDLSLSTPHSFDVTKLIKPGKQNTIEVKIYNGIENVCVGQDSHSVTDQTQGNWNGITGKMELTAMPGDLSIERVRVYPDAANSTATVKVLVNGKMKKNVNASAEAVIGGVKPVVSTDPVISGDTLTFTLDMGHDMKTWDEFSPSVYTLNVKVGDDSSSTVFGMRDIKTGNREINLNGHNIYMRGTVENCCFPLTGYAPTDEASWTAVFKKCKEYGINMMRFHSYCPPEAAFAAADKAGIYLQPEGPSWPNHGVKLNAGMAIDKYLLDESKRIVDTYGNHPSFVMMAAGNEPAGRWVEYCDDWVREMKSYDSTKIYCGASVGGGWQWDEGSEYHVKGGGRGLTWSKKMPQSTDDYTADLDLPRNFKPTDNLPVNTDPILAHEQGQWCAFPNLREVSQYTGPYKARNFEIFADLLKKNGMESMAGKFLDASGRLQTLCYKYEIERNLRTPGYTGFQLLALNDYSGQGTALEGVLNVFWREKGYVNGEQWREFCSPVVPLARFPKFVYTSGDTLSVDLEVMNACSGSLPDTNLDYAITDSNGNTLMKNSVAMTGLTVGKNHKATTVAMPLSDLPAPAKYTLTANLGDAGRNHWEFWVYPDSLPQTDLADDIYVTDTFDSEALNRLNRGDKVLLTAAGKVTLGDDVVQHYLPVFWNTSWFKMRPPHTTGATIDSIHPLFDHGFPTDSWSNLNWWELLNRAQVMNLVNLPEEYQSPVQPIDTWHVSRKLGMIVEANVLNGKLFMTTFDIDSDLDKRVVARQMRHAIVSYISSERFNPSITLTPDQITAFFTTRTQPIKMYTNDSPDELKPTIK